MCCLAFALYWAARACISHVLRVSGYLPDQWRAQEFEFLKCERPPEFSRWPLCWLWFFAYLGFYPGCGPHLLRGARLCVFVAAGFAASTAVACQPPRTRAAPEIARTIAATQRIDIAESAETAVEYERTPKPKSKAPETETAELQVFKLVAKEAVAGLSEVVNRFILSFILATPFESAYGYSDARISSNNTLSVARHTPFGQAIFAVV